MEATLREMFPHQPVLIVQEAIRLCYGDFDKAVDILLHSGPRQVSRNGGLGCFPDSEKHSE